MLPLVWVAASALHHVDHAVQTMLHTRLGRLAANYAIEKQLGMVRVVEPPVGLVDRSIQGMLRAHLDLLASSNAEARPFGTVGAATSHAGDARNPVQSVLSTHLDLLGASHAMGKPCKTVRVAASRVGHVEIPIQGIFNTNLGLLAASHAKGRPFGTVGVTKPLGGDFDHLVQGMLSTQFAFLASSHANGMAMKQRWPHLRLVIFTIPSKSWSMHNSSSCFQPYRKVHDSSSWGGRISCGPHRPSRPEHAPHTSRPSCCIHAVLRWLRAVAVAALLVDDIDHTAQRMPDAHLAILAARNAVGGLLRTGEVAASFPRPFDLSVQRTCSTHFSAVLLPSIP